MLEHRGPALATAAVALGLALTGCGSSSGGSSSSTSTTARTTAVRPAADAGPAITSTGYTTNAPKGWLDVTARARATASAQTLANVEYRSFAEPDTKAPRTNLSIRDGTLKSGGASEDVSSKTIAQATQKALGKDGQFETSTPLESTTLDGEEAWILTAKGDVANGQGAKTPVVVRQLVAVHKGRYIQLSLSTPASADNGEQLLKVVSGGWHWTS